MKACCSNLNEDNYCNNNADDERFALNRDRKFQYDDPAFHIDGKIHFL